MFIFRSGKNYGSYTVTEILPKNVSFKERFQHAFQEVDDVFVVRDDSFQYSKGTADLLSPEYGEIIEKMETAPSEAVEAPDEGGDKTMSQAKTTEQMSLLSDRKNSSRMFVKEKKDRSKESSSHVTHGTLQTKALERASWEEMEIDDRECQAVEEHGSQVRQLQLRSMAHN
jgi:hypothetical protein